MCKVNKQNGNALFLILIAVALFAALSYAVTQSGRSGGGINREQATIDAANMIQYAGQIQQAIYRLKLINGCTENTISVEGVPDKAGTSINASAPADKSCHIFDPEGGGVSPIKFNARSFIIPASAGWTSNYAAWWKMGDTSFNPHEIVPNVGTANAELLFQIFPLSLEVCTEINRKLSINAPTFSPPAGNIYISYFFEGFYFNDHTMIIYENDKIGGCYYESSYQMYIYVQPVIER